MVQGSYLAGITTLKKVMLSSPTTMDLKLIITQM